MCAWHDRQNSWPEQVPEQLDRGAIIVERLDSTGSRPCISGVLNDQPELGRIGAARSSGGSSAARFVRPGMDVIESDGTLLGTVAAVEGHLIRLAGEEDMPCHVPFALVDGVDDCRVILSGRGDSTFGIAA